MGKLTYNIRKVNYQETKDQGYIAVVIGEVIVDEEVPESFVETLNL